jgi:hypothetical protein
MVTEVEAAFAYARGEEVVVRLRRARVFHLEGGGGLSAACVPSWTIGYVMATRRDGRGRASYLVRFSHDGSDCVCWVRERAIEGVC